MLSVVKSVLFGWMMLVTSPALAAGVGSSGGGVAVVCRDSSGGVTRVQLFDLYEAVHRYQLQLKPAFESLEQNYSDYVWELTQMFYGKVIRQTSQAIQEHLKRELDGLVFLPPGQKHPLLSDLGQTVPLLPGCRFEQVAIYDDSTEIPDRGGSVERGRSVGRAPREGRYAFPSGA